MPDLGEVPPYITILFWCLVIFLGAATSLICFFFKRYLEKNDSTIEKLTEAMNNLALVTQEFRGEIKLISNTLARHERNITTIFKNFGREIKNYEGNTDV